MADGYPEVATAELEANGWARRVRSESEVFRTPTAAIIGHTVLYDDADLRTALSDAGHASLLAGEQSEDGERMIDTGETDGGLWRFFFATALSFRPPLAPGIGPASMRPTVVSEARRSFVSDLEARGFEDVERGRSQRVRTETRDRARLQKVTATYPFGSDAPVAALDVEGWIAVWATSGSFRIAGGAYPIRGLGELLAERPAEERPETDPTAYRNELLDLLRSVR